MEANPYLQVLESRKTDELEGCHLLESPNERARMRVSAQGRERRDRLEEWKQFHAIWWKQGRDRMNKENHNWLLLQLVWDQVSIKRKEMGSCPYIGLRCGPHYL